MIIRATSSSCGTDFWLLFCFFFPANVWTWHKSRERIFVSLSFHSSGAQNFFFEEHSDFALCVTQSLRGRWSWQPYFKHTTIESFTCGSLKLQFQYLQQKCFLSTDYTFLDGNILFRLFYPSCIWASIPAQAFFFLSLNVGLLFPCRCCILYKSGFVMHLAKNEAKETKVKLITHWWGATLRNELET